jgi:hypothetical protein
MKNKLKCGECGDECQFGRYYKKYWNLLSIDVVDNYFIIGIHTDNEVGGSCSSVRVSKKKLLSFLKKITEVERA